MKAMVKSSVAVRILLLICASVHAQIPAFPGAEGYGAYANDGRSGDVYTVVNRNSSGPGSLKYGIQNAPAAGCAIVFVVSGYIPIANDSSTGDKTLLIDKNKITIAGQTAPGDGIQLYNYSPLIFARDLQREVVILNMDYSSDRNPAEDQFMPHFRNIHVRQVAAAGQLSDKLGRIRRQPVCSGRLLQRRFNLCEQQCH